MLYFKGYQAVQVHRIAHELWLGERSNGSGGERGKKGDDGEGGGGAAATKSGVRASRVMARMLQSRVSEVFAVDIHPAATLGRGLLLDHGTGVVIGVRERESFFHFFVFCFLFGFSLHKEERKKSINSQY
jgi:serine O-acetyltransferase